jgi:hypothetical protein
MDGKEMYIDAYILVGKFCAFDCGGSYTNTWWILAGREVLG